MNAHWSPLPGRADVLTFIYFQFEVPVQFLNSSSLFFYIYNWILADFPHLT